MRKKNRQEEAEEPEEKAKSKFLENLLATIASLPRRAKVAFTRFRYARLEAKGKNLEEVVSAKTSGTPKKKDNPREEEKEPPSSSAPSSSLKVRFLQILPLLSLVKGKIRAFVFHVLRKKIPEKEGPDSQKQEQPSIEPPSSPLFEDEGTFFSKLSDRQSLALSLLVALFFALLVLFVVWWVGFKDFDERLKLLQKDLPAQTVSIVLPEEEDGLDLSAFPSRPEESSSLDESQGPSSVSSTHTADVALPPAPLNGLFERQGDIVLPKVRIEDDLSPFEAYKRPYPSPPNPEKNVDSIKISVVIVDFGISDTLAKKIISFPPEVTFGLSPYAENALQWAKAARANGHEFWMMLPMQTPRYGVDDTGPYTIFLNGSLEENTNRFFHVLSSAQGYAGVLTTRGHVFTDSDPLISPIIKQIFGRGLGLAEMTPFVNTPPKLGHQQAVEFGYPFAFADIWLDDTTTVRYMPAFFERVMTLAKRKGFLVLCVEPVPAALKALSEWMVNLPRSMDNKTIEIVPLSAMIEGETSSPTPTKEKPEEGEKRP